MIGNHIKTAALLGLLMGILVLVGANWGVTGMVIAFILGGAVNIGAWFFSDKLAIATMKCKEITPDSGPDVPGSMSRAELYHMIDELRTNAGLPMPRVYISPHAAPNAFATGRSPNKAAIAFTAGLLQNLSREEIAGVAAHELAHVKHRDTLISSIAATIAGMLAMLAQFGFWFMLGRNSNGNPLVMLGVVIIGAVGAAMIKAAISRTREFGADAEGARIAGTPRGLASALQKLDRYSKQIPLEQPNPAQNNMFIVEPLTGNKTLMSLFASHPPAEKRIAELRKLEGQF